MNKCRDDALNETINKKSLNKLLNKTNLCKWCKDELILVWDEI